VCELRNIQHSGGPLESHQAESSQANDVKGLTLSPEGPVVMGLGTIDPKSPDEISGSDTVTVPTNKGGERNVHITWSLKRCKE
jgi:hypothetical protein